MSNVVQLEHYRAVWRVGGACCARCGKIWEAVLHVEVRLGQIRCPKCGKAGCVTLSGLTRPGPMPEHVRAQAREMPRVAPLRVPAKPSGDAS